MMSRCWGYELQKKTIDPPLLYDEELPPFRRRFAWSMARRLSLFLRSLQSEGPASPGAGQHSSGGNSPESELGSYGIQCCVTTSSITVAFCLPRLFSSILGLEQQQPILAAVD
ncbi:hypothetical protein M0657_002680 [Pyricularia oryzae]|nr:hypothetical protein M0657_002680 [Pyricularia oryzae]